MALADLNYKQMTITASLQGVPLLCTGSPQALVTVTASETWQITLWGHNTSAADGDITIAITDGTNTATFTYTLTSKKCEVIGVFELVGVSTSTKVSVSSSLSSAYSWAQVRKLF